MFFYSVAGELPKLGRTALDSGVDLHGQSCCSMFGIEPGEE